MPPLFDESAAAFQDLPPHLQEALRRFSVSRSDEDLDVVIGGLLEDLGADLESGNLPDDANFTEDLGLDSLAIAEFVFFFEDVLRIKISNETLADMRTLGALKAFLKSEMK